MSYDIAIVDAPVSQDDAIAWKELEALLEQDGPPTQKLRQVYEELVSRYPCISTLSREEFDDDPDSPWATGPLFNEFRANVAHIPLRYSRVYATLPFIVAAAHRSGLPVFDLSSDQIHRGDGLLGLTLEVEGRPLLFAPKLDQIAAAVDEMTPRGGPGFLVLSGPGENYAQTAGGDGAYLLEWREYGGGSFRHWVAGYPLTLRAGVDLGEMGDRHQPDGSFGITGEVKIPTNGAYVTGRRNEILSAADVKALLTAFAQKGERQDTFIWRDITSKFV
jgi:hypothetical protein